jgi:hypothetical protein
MVAETFIVSLLSGRTFYCGHDPVERQACSAVCLGDGRLGGCFELAEAGLVFQHHGRAEVAHPVRRAPQFLRAFEPGETTQEVGAGEPGEIALDDEDHAPRMRPRGGGSKPEKP